MTFEQAYTDNTTLEKGQIVYSTDGKFYYLGNGVSSFRNILPLPVEKRKPVPEGEYRFNYPLLNIDGDVSVDRRLLHLEGREFIRKNVILLLDETISAGQTRTTIKVKPFKFDSERDEDDELRPEDILNIAKEQRFLITSLSGNTSVIEAAEDVEDLNVSVGAIDFVIEPKTFKNTYEKGSLIYFSGAALLNRLTDIESTARRYGRILANSFSIGYILEDINTFGGNEEDGEVLILPKSVETIRIYLFVKIKKGQDFYIESENETYFITANEDAGPGEVELNITENNLPVSILAKQNDVIYLESSFLQGFLNVDPGKVQLGVQQQAKNNAIGQLKQVLLANADVPITTLPLFETKEGYLFHGQLIEVFDTTAEEREVYKFQVRALDGNLEPTVFVIPDTPNVVNVTIEPVFLTDNIGNIDGSWVAEEPKYSTMSRLNLNLQEFQLEVKNISANAQSIASVSGRVSNFEAETFITAQVTQVNGINVTETLAQIQLNADGTSQTSNIKLLASSIDVDGILKVTNSATFNPETNIAFTSYSVNFITTRPDSSALVVGDIWRRLTTSGGTEFVPYIYTATGWKINHTAIDAGNIITGTISTDRLNVNQIITVGTIATQADVNDVVTDLEDFIDSTDIAARDDIAFRLGYTDFADLVTKAEDGQTIISGGFIRTSLIEVDNLFAENILSQTAAITGTLTASTATGKVEISGAGIKAYLIVPEDPDTLTVNIPSDGSAPYFKGAIVTETNSVVDGQFITVNTITADKINVDNLSAIKADLGAVTAGSIVITQNNAENPPEPINRLWFNDGNDGGIAVGGLVKASAPFRLTNAGILTATSANITGTITATAGAIGGITIANNQINSTNDAFIVTSAGALTATSGKIGGWRLTTTKLSSGDANETRIELDEGLNRVSVLKADNSYAVVMGYLSGLPKFIPTWTAIRKFAINDVVLFETDYYKALTANSDKQPTQNETDWELLIDYSPNWDASNYGFWIAQGDRAVIDGDTDFVSGSWLVQEDASFLIQSGGATVARLGTYNGTRGLFFNEGATGTAFRSTLTPSTLYVGNDSSHLRWDGTNLIIKGNIRQTASGTEVLEPNIVGTWNSETPYDRGDVVLHPDGNRYIWTGTNGTVNISIPNANWLLFVEQGVQGIQGVQGDPAPQVISQYSADGATDWVNDFDGSIHKFIRISVDGGASYNITKIVGDQGIPGSVTEYQYAVNSSLTVAPVEADWKNTVDPVGAGQFLWTRIRVCIDGDCLSWSAGIRLTGEEGDQGEPGEPGNGIASTTTTYQLSANGTTPPPDSPTEDWLIAIPTLVQGQFLWTRVVITYTDNTTSTSYITSYIPIDGTNGLAGPGVVYRGTWAAGVQYIRNPQRADVVLFNGDYWIAKQTNTDVTPILGDNWDDFGATFTSVATGLLLTENAVVTKTISIGKDNTIGLVGDTDYPYITIGQGAQIGYDKTGIFIGQDNVATVAVPKLSLKSSTNSLLWDGTNLSVTGAVRATSGSFSGSISASTATFGNLALGVGGSFNSIPNSTNVGAVLGLVGGAGQLPNGWEYSAPVDFLSSSLTVNTANANDLTLNFTGDRTGEAGGFLQIFLMSNDNVIPTFGDVEWTLSLGAFSITQIVPDSILGSIRFILQELDANKTPLAENRIELHESATSITKITSANTRYLKVFFEINLTDILGSADEPNFNFTLTQPQLEQNPSRSAFQPTPTSAFIINSPNFKVTNTGVVTAVNGSFTGEITATSGSLGALNVGGTLTLDTTNGVIESAEYYLDTTEGIRIDKNSIALGFNTVAGTIRSRLLITQTGIYRDFAPGGDNEWFLKDDGLTLNSGQSVRIKNDTESTDLATGSTIIEGGLVAKKNARFGNVFVHGGTYHSSEGNAGITGFITTGGGTINYENGLIVSIT
jgi:hypothetical protein